jgi:hypothetical protein
MAEVEDRIEARFREVFMYDRSPDLSIAATDQMGRDVLQSL